MWMGDRAAAAAGLLLGCCWMVALPWRSPVSSVQHHHDVGILRGIRCPSAATGAPICLRHTIRHRERSTRRCVSVPVQPTELLRHRYGRGRCCLILHSWLDLLQQAKAAEAAVLTWGVSSWTACFETLSWYGARHACVLQAPHRGAPLPPEACCRSELAGLADSGLSARDLVAEPCCGCAALIPLRTACQAGGTGNAAALSLKLHRRR